MTKQRRPLFGSFAAPLDSFNEAAELKVGARISVSLGISNRV